MGKKHIPFLAVGVIVLVVVSALFLQKPGNKVSSTSKAASYDTVFPLPNAVETFTKSSGDAINFQTTLDIKKAQSFYKAELTKMGLTERTINTSSTETTFSMVFDGYKNRKAVVVQGVDISGKTNINIRFEEI